MSLMDKDLETLKTGSNFHFSATKIDKLGAAEYSLATLVLDRSGSVAGFAPQLENAVKTILKSCQKSPRSDNLMFRFTQFNDTILETHGFKELNRIKESDYDGAVQCDGMTALYRATQEAIEATLAYGERLTTQDFLVNGIVFVVTDGEDNQAGTTPERIRSIVEDARKGEKMESLTVVLVGVTQGNSGLSGYLKDFADRAGISQYIDIGSATPGKCAKLANFVSQSISSTSSALGTGAPSQPINPAGLAI